MGTEEKRESIYTAMRARSLPGWDELPDFELYMDQVLSLIGRYLSKFPDSEERPLTSSMVNNYVKLKVMPPPVSKRYSRMHIVFLLIICTLKSVIPISSIQRLLEPLITEEDVKAFYERFRGIYREANTELAESLQRDNDSSPEELILHTALRSQAEQEAALSLLSVPDEDTPPTGKENKGKN